jgi:hypothetical protein
MKTFVMAAAFLAAASATAHAHYIWIERTGVDEARAYFGEWEAGRVETSGGALDNIKTPKAFASDAAKPLALTRQGDHFTIAAPGGGDVRLVEAGLPVRADKETGQRTKALMHAKVGRSETKAALDLELVPTAANGNVFVLILRGAPLARAELEVFGPPRWAKGLRTNDKGEVTIPTPWAGQYVVEIAHLEERKGGSGDEAYDRIRHVSTLTFVSANGVPWAEK